MPDSQTLNANLADRPNVGACKAGVGDERDVVVNGGATDFVTVLQLALRVVFRDIDN